MTPGSTTDDAQSRVALQRKAGNMDAPGHGPEGGVRGGEPPASDRLLAALKPRQERIDEALGHWLSRVTATGPAAVHEATAYSLFAPGKRLRPLLAVLACEAAGG